MVQCQTNQIEANIPIQHDKEKNFDIPSDCTKIKVHFVYAVKHDGRYKARLVAGGHLTDIPNSSIYSGVASLKGIRIIINLAKLNNLPVYSTDIGFAYLEASTKEKVYVIAGLENLRAILIS